jgi:hypothetical protein
MTRIDQITSRLREHFLDETGCAVSVARLDEWMELEPSPTKRLGIYEPVPFDQPGAPPVALWLCPEHIDRHTAELSALLLDEYLSAIMWIGDMMIAGYTDLPDPWERWRHLEEELVDRFPHTTVLLGRIEMRALDAELAADHDS